MNRLVKSQTVTSSGSAVTTPQVIYYSGHPGTPAHVVPASLWTYLARGSAIVQAARHFEPPVIKVEGVGLASQGEWLIYVERPPIAKVSIWRRIADLADQLTPEEAERLPVDLAENVDHYLYNSRRE